MLRLHSAPQLYLLPRLLSERRLRLLEEVVAAPARFLHQVGLRLVFAAFVQGLRWLRGGFLQAAVGLPGLLAGCDLAVGFVCEVELEQVVDESLVDVLGLGLHVQLLEEVEDLELLVAAAVGRREVDCVFLLEQTERGGRVQPVVLVADEQPVELPDQLLGGQLLLLAAPGGLLGEVPAEERLLLLALHLPDVVAEQLAHLPRDAVPLLPARLQLREHRRPRHARGLAALDLVALRDALRQGCPERVGDRAVDGLRGGPERAGARAVLLLRVVEVVLVEVVGHAAVEVADLCAVGAVAGDVVLLGVVVAQVVVAELAVQGSQARRLFHYYIPRAEQLPLLIISYWMGNSACCEEEAKAGDFGQVKPRFQPNKLDIQPHKVGTVDFNAQPGNVKTVFIEPRPGGRKEGHKEERNRQAERVESEEDQLPIISSSHIESRYREGNTSSQLLNARPHKQEELEEPEQEQIELEQRQHEAEEGEKAEIQLQEEHRHKQQAEEVELLAPQLTEPVAATLAKEKFFHEQFTFSPEFKRYDSEFYEGQLDETGRFPHGLGRLYKQDRSLYVGHFSRGKAEGQGAFIFPDGSYYSGEFRDNFAEGNGSYRSQAFSYEGEFKRNRFHGKGKEAGAAHEFSGEYYAGGRTYGRLAWKERGEEYEYVGSFANGQFNGEGTLTQPTGTYKGEFISGRKHGYGVYHFKNGLRFEGEYREGLRQGKGALYNPNNRLAYEGEFEAGMPHGEGSILDSSGKKLKTRWVEGIDSTYL